MIGKRAKHITNFITALLLVIISAYYVNSTMFGHCHIINGVTISHSHIHGKHHSELPSGNHTESEVTLINALALTQIVKTNSIVIEPAPLAVEFTIAIPNSYPISSVDVPLHKSPRAPPVFFNC